MLKTQVRERPILFSGEMVKAILDGRKTQTRRIAKNIKPSWEFVDFRPQTDQVCIAWFNDRKGHRVAWPKSPKGKPDDLLWVREAWACVGAEHVKPSESHRVNLQPHKDYYESAAKSGKEK